MTGGTPADRQPGEGRLRVLSELIRDIETPLGEMELCAQALYKLNDLAAKGHIRDTAHEVIGDLDQAGVRARKIFDAMHALVVGGAS